MVLAGGADRKIHLLHAATGQQAVIGAHEAPVRAARFVEVAGSGAPIVATGSWDGTIRYWDARQGGGAAITAPLPCGERVYAMDAKAGLLVAATAARRIHLADLRGAAPGTFARSLDAPLRHQVRAVAVLPDGTGWGTAGIEGRCAINVLDGTAASRYYTRTTLLPIHLQTLNRSDLISLPFSLPLPASPQLLLSILLHIQVPPRLAQRARQDKRHHEGLVRQRRAVPPGAVDGLRDRRLRRELPLLGPPGAVPPRGAPAAV